MCVYLCTLYLCVCARMHAGVQVCAFVDMARDWYYASNNHFTFFFETASLTSWLDCLFSKFQGFSCLCLPLAGSTSTHVTVPGFLPGCLGSGLRCSCFHSKHLTNWAIFPASCLCPPPLNRTGWNQGLLYARQVSITEPHPYLHFALRWSLFQVAQSGLELTL